MSNSLQHYGLQPVTLLCPLDSPGKDTGLGSHALLHGISLTLGSNPHLLHWQAVSLPLVQHVYFATIKKKILRNIIYKCYYGIARIY